MTRDELPHAIGVALVKARERTPRDEWSDYDGEAADIMPLIDAYMQAERERIAQAIEAEATKADECAAEQEDAVLRAGDAIAAIIFRRAARIARAES